jgi:hypothetical protein
MLQLHIRDGHCKQGHCLIINTITISRQHKADTPRITAHVAARVNRSTQKRSARSITGGAVMDAVAVAVGWFHLHQSIMFWTPP